MKTFMICGADGEKLQAEQLATFTHYIQGVQFRFVVTKQEGFTSVPAVTHRASGKRVCEITPTMALACFNDFKSAGKLALSKLIDRVGEARIRSVLSAAESEATK